MAGAVGRSGQYWSAFSPPSVPGLALWYDFSDTSTLDLSDNIIVNRVRDKSGQGRHGTASNTVATYWGYDSVTNGIGRFPGSTATGGNFIFDVSLSAANNFYSVFVAVTGMGTTVQSILSPSAVGGVDFEYSNGFISAGTTTTRALSAQGIDTYSTGVGGYIGGLLLKVFGNDYASNVVTQTVPPLTSVNTTLRLGSYTSAESFYGLLNEILVFSNVVADTDARNIHAYLTKKWMVPFTKTITAPTDISGCTLWLDSSGVSTSNFNFGGSYPFINKWNDKSGNNRDVSTGFPSGISNTAKPIWADVSGYVYFGPNNFLYTNVPLPRTGEETGFMVGVKVTNSAARGFITAQAGSTGPSRSLVSFTGNFYRSRQTNGYSALDVFLPQDTISTVSTSPSLLSWWTRGSIFAGRFAGMLQQMRTDLSAATDTSGFNQLGPAAQHVREIILFDRTLSASEICNVEQYLIQKWSLSNCKTFTRLPSNRPFVSEPGFVRPYQFPHDIQGCTLWLDAKDTDSMVLDVNSNVLRWYDKSGWSNDVSASVPAVSPAVTGPVYSNETIVFSNNRMTVRNPTASSSNFRVLPGPAVNNMTLMALHQPLVVDGSGIGNTGLFDMTSNTSNLSFPTMTGTTPRGYTYTQTAATTRAASTLLDNSVTTEYNMITASIQSNRHTIYRNGVVQQDISGIALNTYTFNATTAVFSIGRYGTTNSNFYQGNVKELFMFNRALAPYEVYQIEGYLARKWNLTGLLSSNHPGLYSFPLVTSVNPLATMYELRIWIDAYSYASEYSNNARITTDWSNRAVGSRPITFAFGSTTSPKFLSNAYLGRPGVDLSGGSFRTTLIGNSSRADISFANFNSVVIGVASYEPGMGIDASAILGWFSADNGPVGGGTSLSTAGIRHRFCQMGRGDGSLNVQCYTSNGNDGGMLSVVPPPAQVPFIFETTCVSSAMTLRVNGSNPRNSLAVTPFGNSAQNASWGYFGLGNNERTNGSTWRGKVFEVIAYAENTSNYDEFTRNKIRAYLATKWGIPGVLPSNHPYKGTSP
jgi:hypothetical protein